MKRFIPLGILALLLVAATQVTEVGGTRMQVFQVAAGADTSFTIADVGGTAADPTWSRITSIAVRNTGTVGVDSLALHLRSGWTVMPYPQGVNDFFEIQFDRMDLIHRASAKPDTVLRYVNNGTGAARIYLWGS